MKFIALTFLFFLTSLSLNAKQDNLTELFNERSKCIVAVSLSIHSEESRNQIFTTGFIANDDGLVVISSDDMPSSARPDEIKDVKLYFIDGDIDGYKGQYLGESSIYPVHFFKFNDKMPKQLRSYKDFPIARPNLGESVWGISLQESSFLLKPFYLTSYVSQFIKDPYDTVYTFNEVAAISTLVFNKDGAVVGLSKSKMLDVRTISIDGEMSPPVAIISLQNSDKFWSPEVIDNIVKTVPKNVKGDSIAWLGLVGTKVLEPNIAKIMGLDKKAGFIVSDVVKNSPAGKAGIEKGDIILAFNAKEFERFFLDSYAKTDLYQKYVTMNVGDEVTLSIMRGSDEPKDFQLVLEESPKTFKQSKTKYFKRIGFSVREYLFSDSINRNEIDNMYDAAVVKFVKQNGPAQSAKPSNLSSFDMITQINSVDVNSYDEAVAQLSKLDEDESVKEIIISAKNYNETKVVRIKLD